MTDVRSFGQRREREVEVNEEGNSSRSEQPRRRRRLPRIDQEIELYCNPFVEVRVEYSVLGKKNNEKLDLFPIPYSLIPIPHSLLSEKRV